MGNRIVVCPYCLAGAELVKGTEVYPGSEGKDYAERNFWLCRKCGAYVGTHKGTDVPLGTLADEELRRLRRQVHAGIDPLWRGKPEEKKARSHVYEILADLLGIKVGDTHVAQFNPDRCREVLRLLGLARMVSDNPEGGITILAALEAMVKAKKKPRVIGGFLCGSKGCIPFSGDREGNGAGD